MANKNVKISAGGAASAPWFRGDGVLAYRVGSIGAANARIDIFACTGSPEGVVTTDAGSIGAYCVTVTAGVTELWTFGGTPGTNTGWVQAGTGGGGGGAADFTDLGDVPASYAGAAAYLLRVNGAATGVEFVDGSGLYDALGAASAVASSLATHAGAADPHPGYQLESEKDAANGYAGLNGSGKLADARVAQSNVTQHNAALDHGTLAGLTDDDHAQYSRADGTRSFTAPVGGVTPTAGAHLATKAYTDALVQGVEWAKSVADRDLTAPPGGPTTGDRYIVATGGTGAWAGHDLSIAEWDGSAWAFTVPTIGTTVAVDDELRSVRWSGSAWDFLESFLSHQALVGAGTNDHAAIDSHLGSTSNPHGTTAAQVGADPTGTSAAAVSAHASAYAHVALTRRTAVAKLDGAANASAVPWATIRGERTTPVTLYLAGDTGDDLNDGTQATQGAGTVGPVATLARALELTGARLKAGGLVQWSITEVRTAGPYVMPSLAYLNEGSTGLLVVAADSATYTQFGGTFTTTGSSSHPAGVEELTRITATGSPGWTASAYRRRYWVEITSGSQIGKFIKVWDNGTNTIDLVGAISGLTTGTTFRIVQPAVQVVGEDESGTVSVTDVGGGTYWETPLVFRGLWFGDGSDDGSTGYLDVSNSMVALAMCVFEGDVSARSSTVNGSYWDNAGWFDANNDYYYGQGFDAQYLYLFDASDCYCEGLTLGYGVYASNHCRLFGKAISSEDETLVTASEGCVVRFPIARGRLLAGITLKDSVWDTGTAFGGASGFDIQTTGGAALTMEGGEIRLAQVASTATNYPVLKRLTSGTSIDVKHGRVLLGPGRTCQGLGRGTGAADLKFGLLSIDGSTTYEHTLDSTYFWDGVNATRRSSIVTGLVQVIQGGDEATNHVVRADEHKLVSTTPADTDLLVAVNPTTGQRMKALVSALRTLFSTLTQAIDANGYGITGLLRERFNTETLTGTSHSPNWANAAFKLHTLSANVTALDVTTNAPSTGQGQVMELWYKQAAAGGPYTLPASWTGVTAWKPGSAPVMSTTASKLTCVTLVATELGIIGDWWVQP